MRNAGTHVKRGAIAFLLSLAMPGVGHIYDGWTAVGLVICLVFVGFGYFAGLLGVLHAFKSAVLYVIINCIFPILIATWAAVVAVREVRTDSVPAKRHTLVAVSVLLIGVVGAVILGFPERVLGIRALIIRGQSMSPTLVVGDRFVVDATRYKTSQPSRGDVIAFSRLEGNQQFVERVVALPGETIEGGPGWLMLDGKLLSEPYLQQTGEPTDDLTFGPVRIPPHELFVMGDNRGQSNDSRSFGPIDANAVLGKALFIYYSSVDKTRIGRAIR